MTALLLKSSLSFSLIGAWWFEETRIDEQRIRIPLRPDLFMCMELKEDGQSRLLWRGLYETGFCERTGKYNFDDGTLNEEVLSVNEKNAEFCAADTDMVTGNKMQTPVELNPEDKLLLHAQLGEEKVTYVFKRVEACPTAEVPPTY